eukprot:gene2525-9418_t
MRSTLGVYSAAAACIYLATAVASSPVRAEPSGAVRAVALDDNLESPRMRRAGEDEEGQYPYQFSLTFAATGNPDDASYRWKYSVGAIVHPRLEGATVSFCECAELCASWPKGRCDGFYYNLDSSLCKLIEGIDSIM